MSTEKTKTGKQTLNRVTLSPNSLALLQGWAEQLKAQFKGMRVKIQDVIEWKLGQTASELSHKELFDFRQKYWNEVEYAAWVVKELSAARDRGESLTLIDFISSSPLEKAPKRRAARQSEDVGLAPLGNDEVVTQEGRIS